jgi:hypothetical protein
MTLSGVLRWVLKGARSPSGQQIRLEAIRLGGRWVTSRQAIQRFAEALTPTFAEMPPQSRKPTAQQLASERAGRELALRGV